MHRARRQCHPSLPLSLSAFSTPHKLCLLIFLIWIANGELMEIMLATHVLSAWELICKSKRASLQLLKVRYEGCLLNRINGCHSTVGQLLIRCCHILLLYGNSICIIELSLFLLLLCLCLCIIIWVINHLINIHHRFEPKRMRR